MSFPKISFNKPHYKPCKFILGFEFFSSTISFLMSIMGISKTKVTNTEMNIIAKNSFMSNCKLKLIH